MTRSLVIFVVLIVQLSCALFFVGQIGISVLGITVTPVSWALYEAIEIAAAVGLVGGAVVWAILLRQSLARTRRAETILAGLSGAFMDLVSQYFEDWSLSPAERDVALFLLKGLSTLEIAGLRGTSEGTIKAQTNAIYRKADVANRAQLVSLFIDDLMQDDTLPKPALPTS